MKQGNLIVNDGTFMGTGMSMPYGSNGPMGNTGLLPYLAAIFTGTPYGSLTRNNITPQDDNFVKKGIEKFVVWASHANDTFIAVELFPAIDWSVERDGLDITFYKRVFGPTLLDAEPVGSMSRNVQNKLKIHKTTLQRFGKQAELYLENLKGERGKKILAGSLQQFGVALNQTLKAHVLQVIISGDIKNKIDSEINTGPVSFQLFSQRIKNEATLFSIVTKSTDGFKYLFNSINDIMAKRVVTFDTLLIPQGTAAYMNLKPEETIYAITGEKKLKEDDSTLRKKIQVWNGSGKSLRVIEVTPIITDDTKQTQLDYMLQDVTIGTFAILKHNGPINGRGPIYSSDSMKIEIFDADNDDIKTITAEMCLDNCLLFDDEGYINIDIIEEYIRSIPDRGPRKIPHHVFSNFKTRNPGKEHPVVLWGSLSRELFPDSFYQKRTIQIVDSLSKDDIETLKVVMGLETVTTKEKPQDIMTDVGKVSFGRFLEILFANSSNVTITNRNDASDPMPLNIFMEKIRTPSEPKKSEKSTSTDMDVMSNINKLKDILPENVLLNDEIYTPSSSPYDLISGTVGTKVIAKAPEPKKNVKGVHYSLMTIGSRNAQSIYGNVMNKTDILKKDADDLVDDYNAYIKGVYDNNLLVDHIIGLYIMTEKISYSNYSVFKIFITMGHVIFSNWSNIKSGYGSFKQTTISDNDPTSLFGALMSIDVVMYTVICLYKALKIVESGNIDVFRLGPLIDFCNLGKWVLSDIMKYDINKEGGLPKTLRNFVEYTIPNIDNIKRPTSQEENGLPKLYDMDTLKNIINQNNAWESHILGPTIDDFLMPKDFYFLGIKRIGQKTIPFGSHLTKSIKYNSKFNDVSKLFKGFGNNTNIRPNNDYDNDDDDDDDDNEGGGLGSFTFNKGNPRSSGPRESLFGAKQDYNNEVHSKVKGDGMIDYANLFMGTSYKDLKTTTPIMNEDFEDRWDEADRLFKDDVHKFIYRMSLGTVISKDFFKETLKKNMPFPGSFLIMRPFQEYQTGLMMAVKSGLETGFTVVSDSDIAEGTNPNSKNSILHFSTSLAAGITELDNVYIIPNTYIKNHIRGGGVGFFKHKYELQDREKYNKSIICAYLAPGEEPPENYLDLMGYFNPNEVLMDTNGYDIYNPQFLLADFYARYWGYEHSSNPSAKPLALQDPNNPVKRMNTLMMRDWWKYNEITSNGMIIPSVRESNSHLGPTRCSNMLEILKGNRNMYPKSKINEIL